MAGKFEAFARPTNEPRRRSFGPRRRARQHAAIDVGDRAIAAVTNGTPPNQPFSASLSREWDETQEKAHAYRIDGERLVCSAVRAGRSVRRRGTAVDRRAVGFAT